MVATFGFTIDFTDLDGKPLTVVEALFAVLTIIEVVNDPTTAGLKYSNAAMTYEAPKSKED